MKRSALVTTLVFALAPAGTALAGGTSTSGESSDSEGTGSADTSTGDASSSETTDGTCETCPPSTSAGAIEFSDLEHGTPPAGERVVEVQAQTKCSCSECACFDDEASQIRLELDGDEVGEPCSGAQCEFVVVLTPGEHELTAIATYQSGEVSESVQLLVPSEGGSTETGTPIEDDESSGCGCTSSRTRHPLALVMIVAALARRRRALTR